MGLIPRIGAELEFYLSGIFDPSSIEDIPCDWLRESGCNQYELRFFCQDDPVVLASSIHAARRRLERADFSANPRNDMPSSGMHIHLNFIDVNGKNIFAQESLFHAIGGLCLYMKKHMRYFAPNKESYTRFGKSREAPNTISWGPNNRTAAIRIPDTNNNPGIKRLEHRVAGADADPFEVILAVISGALYGIKNRITPLAATYGLAFDKQYSLEGLPRDLCAAEQEHESIDIILLDLCARG